MQEQTVVAQAADSRATARIVYILYLVGLVFGITGIVGVVTAYINKSDAPGWLAEHYRFQIRTFWIGGLYLLLGVLLALVVVGYFVLLFWLVWLIVRSVKGLKALEKGQAPDNPGSWLFG